jgi:alpha-aminoadipic semialdehyde synthase
MLDALWALGQRLELEGIATPLANLGRARDYHSIAEAEAAVSAAGAQIRAEGLPDRVTPMIIAVTGRGHVARGVQEVLSHLPLVRVLPEDIPSLASMESVSRHVVYAAEFRRADLYAPRDPDAHFDATELEAHPDAWRGRLEEYVDHLTAIVNGIYWEPRYPRLLTREYFRDHWDESPKRLRLVADITCDIAGSVEFTVKSTTSDRPVFVYRPRRDDIVDGLEGDGPVVLAVDKLPAELPRESTESFGRSLLRFVPGLARADFQREPDAIGLPEEFRRALIVHRGRLTENFRYLNSYVLRKGT